MVPRTATPHTAHSGSDGLEGVSFYLGRAYYRYVALVEGVLRELGVTDRVHPGMGHVLFALYEKDDRIIKDIVDRSDVAPSTLTGILRKMEKNGLVVRRPDKADGRAVRIRLTPLAKKLEPALRRVQVRVHDVMYADLTAAELSAVRRALARMTAAMRKYESNVTSSDSPARNRKKRPRSTNP